MTADKEEANVLLFDFKIRSAGFREDRVFFVEGGGGGGGIKEDKCMF